MKKLVLLLIILFSFSSLYSIDRISECKIVDHSYSPFVSFDNELEIQEGDTTVGYLQKHLRFVQTEEQVGYEYIFILKDAEKKLVAYARTFLPRSIDTVDFEVFDSQGKPLGMVKNYFAKMMDISGSGTLYSVEGTPLLNVENNTLSYTQQFKVPESDTVVMTLSVPLMHRRTQVTQIKDFEYLGQTDFHPYLFTLFVAIRSEIYSFSKDYFDDRITKESIGLGLEFAKSYF